MKRSASIIAAALLATACGGAPAQGPTTVAAVEPAQTRPSPAAEATSPAEEAAEEVSAEAEEPPPPPPPPPPPTPVAAGERMGPITIGMSEADVRGLALEEQPLNSRYRRFGPYRVRFVDGSVFSVEAQLGDIAPIEIDGTVYPVDVSIYTLRDALPDCVWREGGGERYRCADGHLTVETTHSMASEAYTLGVYAR